MPNFELYERMHSRAGGSHAATVTIQRRGLISFSPLAIRELGSPEAFVLLFDEAESLIGFRAARQGEPMAYPVRGPKGSHIISATSFCRHLGLSLSESRRYPLAEVDGTHCIDVKQPGTVVTSNRRRQP